MIKHWSPKLRPLQLMGRGVLSHCALHALDQYVWWEEYDKVTQ